MMARQRPWSDRIVKRNGSRSGRIRCRLLHGAMAAALTDRHESMLLRIWQISRPERTLTLPNRDLDLGHEHVAVVPSPDLGRVRCFEKQCKCFDQVRAGLFNRHALARDVQFRTQRNEAIVFSLDDGGKSLRSLHGLGL